MNPELLLSFVVMQALAPAGTTIPAEALLTSADAMPAWARFTFQVYVIQKLQEQLNECKTERDELKKHHEEPEKEDDSIEQECEALKKEIAILFQTLKLKFGDKRPYKRVVEELQKRPDIPNLTKLYASGME